MNAMNHTEQVARIRAAILRRREAGDTYRDIAADTGVSYETLRNIASPYKEQNNIALSTYARLVNNLAAPVTQEVQGNGGTYTMTVGIGWHHCTCPDFQHRRGPLGEPCKHLEDWQKRRN